jgi:hypothetical protein
MAETNNITTMAETETSKQEEKPKPRRNDSFGSSIPETSDGKGKVHVPPEGRNGPPLGSRPDRQVL